MNVRRDRQDFRMISSSHWIHFSRVNTSTVVVTAAAAPRGLVHRDTFVYIEHCPCAVTSPVACRRVVSAQFKWRRGEFFCSLSLIGFNIPRSDTGEDECLAEYLEHDTMLKHWLMGTFINKCRAELNVDQSTVGLQQPLFFPSNPVPTLFDWHGIFVCSSSPQASYLCTQYIFS